MPDDKPTQKRPPSSPAAGMPAQPNWAKAKPYAWLAGGAFVGSVLLLLLLLTQAGKLAALGLVGSLYFLILVPLGLGVAAFLFGAMRSYARYRGRQQGGWLEIGGPIVGFIIVLLLGFSLGKPERAAFDLTVFVQGEGGPSDQALRNTGEVWLQLGADRQHERIDDKGRAVFHQLAPQFRLGNVTIWVEAAGFETVQPSSAVQLDGQPLTLVVRRKTITLSGRLQDESGQPVAGGTIRVAGQTASADANGEFQLVIPGSAAAGDIELQVVAPGYTNYWRRFPPGGAPVVVILKRQS